MRAVFQSKIAENEFGRGRSNVSIILQEVKTADAMKVGYGEGK